MEDLLNDDINFKQNANEIVPGAYCLADKFKVVLFKITRSGTWKPPRQHQHPLIASMSNELSDIAKSTHLYKLAKLKYIIPRSRNTFENIIVPLAEFSNNNNANYFSSTFLAKVSTDEQICRASEQFKQIVDGNMIDTIVGKQLYKLLRNVCNNKEEMNKLDEEDRQLVRKLESRYCDNGLALATDTASAVYRISKSITKVEIDFLRNAKESVAGAYFTRDELAGMPNSFFGGRETEIVNGILKYKVTTNSSDYNPIMDYACLEDTRKHMFSLYGTLCPENVYLLQKAMDLRLKKAQLLGYKSHADFTLKSRMAKTPENVLHMLKDLQEKLTPLAKIELDTLVALKETDMENLGKPFTGFYRWDVHYYKKRALANKTIDCDNIKEYFPLPRVISGILAIYEQLLGLQVTKVDKGNVWHHDVEYYTVMEASSDTLVGTFYLDLYSRKSKSNSAVTCKLRPGYKDKNNYITPIAAMVVSLQPPTSDSPTLLEHTDIVTLMHEFGHVFHEICSRTKWSQLHGFETDSDFEETPSQMMENWAWEPSVLREFASHYQTNMPIPEELLESIVGSRKQWPALTALHQIALATYDLRIHDTQTPIIDINQQFNELVDSITLIGRGDLSTHRVSMFTHMCGNYDSKYYTYIWSQIHAADMFASRFMKDGLDNPQTGRDYRNEILRPGSSRDPMINLKQFLGRMPNSKAFLKSVGLE